MNETTITAEGVALDRIQTSPLNPRKHFDEAQLAELTDSIRRLGVLQPVLLRPVNGHLELVAGERRYRAARAAGLAEIPAVVRELDDRQAAEARLVENLARADLDPLEEAEGFHLLHERHEYSVDEIATKVSQSRAYVYARMKLCELPDRVKDAMTAGELSPSVALLLARLPEDVAEEALPHMFRRAWVGSEQETIPVTFRVAQTILRERFARRLKDASWDLGDDTLPGGACATCPKRTGSEPDLFADLVPDRSDVCTDVGCWKMKLEAWGQRKLEDAKASGSKVLDAKEAKKVFQYGDRPAYGCGYVDLKEQGPWEAAGKSGRPPKWKTAIGGKVAPEDLVVAIDAQGQVRELIAEKRAFELARENGKEWAEKAKRPAADDGEKKRREKQKLARAATDLALAELVAKAEAAEQLDDGIWAMLARSVWDAAWTETQKTVGRRRGWGPEKGGGTAMAFPEEMSGAVARGVLVELLGARDAVSTYDGSTGRIFTRVCEAFQVDLKAHQKAARAALKPKKKASAKKRGSGRKGKTTRAAILEVLGMATEPLAVAEIIPAVVEISGAAEASVRTTINALTTKGELRQVPHEGRGFKYRLREGSES